MNSSVYDIALTFLPGIGVVKAAKIISHWGSAEAFFKNSKHGPRGSSPLNWSAFSTMAPALEKAHIEYDYCQKTNTKVLTSQMDSYPKRLLECADYPHVVYSQGEVNLNPARMVSIVGTRTMTSYGKKMVVDLVDQLQNRSVTVISGLAYGVDITVHRQCLEKGIPTLGVLAHGLDRMYPSSHKREAQLMVDHQGGLLTEFPSGGKPSKENFPKRNRIVAGMSDAVVVVEAAPTGGALITANLANSYHRDVFAFPGPVGALYSSGCNQYIKSHRAHLIENAKDLEYVMGWGENVTDQDVEKKLKREREEKINHLDEKSQCILRRILEVKERRLELLALDLDLEISECLAQVLLLELDGWVQMEPGQMVTYRT